MRVLTDQVRFDGPAIRKRREARGLTQEQCARLAGCSRQLWAQWERAAAEALSEKDLTRIWDAFLAADAAMDADGEESK